MQKKSQSRYYQPAEDTIFFAENIRDERGKTVIDVGTGSGFLAQMLLKNFELVVATDININALKKAHETIENCICCKSADAISSSFDLVICNLPYLPSEEILDPAVDGLRDGVKVPIEIIRSANTVLKKKGKLIFLTSSLANYKELFNQTKKLGFETKIIAKKKLFFEELILVECIKNP